MTIEEFLKGIIRIAEATESRSTRFEVKVKSTYWSRVYGKTMEAEVRGLSFDTESKTLYIEFDKTSSK